MTSSRVKVVTVQQIQALDAIAIEQYGISSLVLMENAGRSVADVVRREIPRRGKAEVSIFCGIGHNGGDGFVAARHLRSQGIKPHIFLIGSAAELKKDAAVNYRILRNIPCPVQEIQDIHPQHFKILKRSSVIVDAIFGVGLNRPLQDPFRTIIEQLNSLKKKVIAVDIPSGLDGTTGRIWGACVNAAVTVTFSFPKKGFYIQAGPQHTGKIVVADIGIPKKVITSQCHISQRHM
ncbi:MAG: NAD(P)H-hydrate epimerase [Omnitrophica WOR_2 bacterium RIFCSPHIGHO2_01_FULL_48_9]|nr:MAG: NAD(P)H-hydrate epimerase [Omnitrophica WOR_2 bacterium RIFCSPHIGHO2_02_FULL_48_11]OGX29923.1 MAG: NAD(P)H-hydrate epimerase [Omnitrophica WOR_2 bacterium RIFCSPHIGHO2_01_FULL_48_9]